MNSQSPTNEPFDRREARRQRRANRSGGWVAGLILIVLGIAFLLQNSGFFNFPFKNWWALFILLPAIGALGGGYQIYRNAGNRLTAPARASLMLGMIICLTAAAFLFELDWTFFGPAIIILAGLGILVNYMIPGKG